MKPINRAILTSNERMSNSKDKSRKKKTLRDYRKQSIKGEHK